MVSPDRKRQILAHLSQSIDNPEFLTPKPVKSPESSSPPAEPIPDPLPPPPPEPPVSRRQEQKRRVLTHVRQTSGGLGEWGPSPTAKQKVLDHIRRSLG